MLILNGPVLATDRDIGPNAVVKYGLIGPRVDLFTINPTTGEIRFWNIAFKPFNTSHSLIDMEKKTHYDYDKFRMKQKWNLVSVTSSCFSAVAVVSVREGAVLDREAFSDPRVELFLVSEDIGGLNSSVPLTITILDRNDNPPVFSPSSFTVRLPENSPTGKNLWETGFSLTGTGRTCISVYLRRCYWEHLFSPC